MITKNPLIAAALWLAAIAIAMCFDRAVAVWSRDAGIDMWLRSHRALTEFIKTPGTFAFTAVVVIVVALTHVKRWRAGGFILLAAGVSGANYVTKWASGRSRPFKLDQATAQPFFLSPFRGGIGGFMASENLCFPSGHASLAFATAAAVAILWPRAKWRWCAYSVAALVAVERVLENAHWLSDSVAGAALGVGGAHLVAWILSKLMPQTKEATIVS